MTIPSLNPAELLAFAGVQVGNSVSPTVDVNISDDIVLSDEQQVVIDEALAGNDLIVDAVPGSGKTHTIQILCKEIKKARPFDSILYLTYSKLLKEEAQKRVQGAKVQNYHGIVYPSLLKIGSKAGFGESIAEFNANWDQISPSFATYDVLIIDEYQDITAEYAELLWNIKSKNPIMQVIMVGDMEQRVNAASKHNAQDFAAKFCVEPKLLPFTKSFRVGPEVAKRLSAGWNKPIVGANTEQQVGMISFAGAVGEMLKMSDRPQDILALGKLSPNGQLAAALNAVEKDAPAKFNKKTTYAAIQGHSNAKSTANAAVFTSLDASKGMERDTCFVFDYDEKMWDVRNGFAGADPEILRNVFLVAASRGKSRILFVGGSEDKVVNLKSDMLGDINLKCFTDLPVSAKPSYDTPFSIDEMFNFKYVENVEAAFDLLDVKRFNDGGELIKIDTTDGHIDLSPVIEQYQRALFFTDFDVYEQVFGIPFVSSALAGYMDILDKKSFEDGYEVTKWDISCALVAAISGHARYANQVATVVDKKSEAALMARLGSRLDSSDIFQEQVVTNGEVFHTRLVHTPLGMAGIIDAVHNDEPYALTYAEELTHSMALALATKMVIGDYEVGHLWNTRTNDRWEIRIGDRQRFMDAVTVAITKQEYKTFKIFE